MESATVLAKMEAVLALVRSVAPSDSIAILCRPSSAPPAPPAFSSHGDAVIAVAGELLTVKTLRLRASQQSS